MPRRRGNNEGSIYKRNDGRWAAVISCRDFHGRNRRKYIYGKTRKAVQEKLIKNLADQHKGLIIASEKQTLEEFLVRWLQDSVKGTTSENTLVSYTCIVRKHIVPILGSIPLQKLQPQQVQYLYRKKQEEGLTRTVQLIHAVLHRALNQAMKWNMVQRNVTDIVDRPKFPRREMKVLTQDEVNCFLKSAREGSLYALYVLAITCGLRQGELLALKWKDFDREAGTLHIQRQIQWVKGKAQFKEPKTSKSRRTVMLPRAAVAALQTHRARQAEQRLAAGGKWQNHGLIFTSEVGTAINQSNLLSKSFYPLLKKAEVPRIRFHDLRHTAATLLLQQGVHPKIVQERLGHSRISMTLDTYSHVLPAMQQEAADKMDAILDLT